MNQSVIARFATSEPTVCAVCRRRAVGLGYTPRQGAKTIWLCDAPECHASARKVYSMPATTLDAYETGAMIAAGDKAGAYLDEIGKTDLATLTLEEWREFGRRFVFGYEDALRHKLLTGEAPF